MRASVTKCVWWKLHVRQVLQNMCGGSCVHPLHVHSLRLVLGAADAVLEAVAEVVQPQRAALTATGLGFGVWGLGFRV